MKNMAIIAWKEFLDLTSSRLTLIILAGFIITSLFNFGTTIMTIEYLQSNPATDFLGSFMYTLSYYGSLVGIILGFTSISSELERHALNNLLVKPVYRDTIVNGKILGFIGLFVCIFVLSAIFYMCSTFAYFGDRSYGAQIAFLNSLPLAFILTFLCVTFAYALSMLVYIIIKNQSMALFTSFLLWILLFSSLSDGYFIHAIEDATHNAALGPAITSFSPYTMVNFIFLHQDLQSALLYNGGDLFRLLLYGIVAVICAYTAFMRSDIA